MVLFLYCEHKVEGNHHNIACYVFCSTVCDVHAPSLVPSFRAADAFAGQVRAKSGLSPCVSACSRASSVSALVAQGPRLAPGRERNPYGWLYTAS